jgi:hypothetical protein
MGEAKRKRVLAAREWIGLFSPDSPVKAAISRPSCRTSTTRLYESAFAADIVRRAATVEPALCLNPECSNELRALPTVFAFVKTSDNPASRPIGMGICDQCAQKSDDELREVMRKTFDRFGLYGEKDKHTKVEMDIEVAHRLDVGQLKVVVPRTDRFSNNTICDAAQAFACLVRDGKLGRFTAFYFGAHNCHALVAQLRLDLCEIGAERLFAFKRGSSELLKSEIDPDGLHSWVEVEGWAIDVSGGALGNPIVIQPIEDFCIRYRMADVCDIAYGRE